MQAFTAERGNPNPLCVSQSPSKKQASTQRAHSAQSQCRDVKQSCGLPGRWGTQRLAILGGHHGPRAWPSKGREEGNQSPAATLLEGLRLPALRGWARKDEAGKSRTSLLLASILLPCLKAGWQEGEKQSSWEQSPRTRTEEWRRDEEGGGEEKRGNNQHTRNLNQNDWLRPHLRLIVRRFEKNVCLWLHICVCKIERN